MPLVTALIELKIKRNSIDIVIPVKCAVRCVETDIRVIKEKVIQEALKSVCTIDCKKLSIGD